MVILWVAGCGFRVAVGEGGRSKDCSLRQRLQGERSARVVGGGGVLFLFLALGVVSGVFYCADWDA